MFRATVVLSVCFLLMSCATTGNLDSNYELKERNPESVLILGVNQQRDYRIALNHGTIESERLGCHGLPIPDVNVVPKDGFIVVKLPPTDINKRYVVGGVVLNGTILAWLPRDGHLNPVITVPPHSVVYVGTLDVVDDSKTDQLTIRESFDFESARTFMNGNYPQLARFLVKGDMGWMLTYSCHE